MFGRGYHFKLPKGKDEQTTGLGCVLTVLVIFSSMFYGSMQSIKLFTFDETDVMISSRATYFDDTFVFENNLMFSFGLTAYDSNPDIIEDPSIGVVKPYYKSWGLDNTVSGVKWEELPLRKCTLAEFHLRNETDPNSTFFKPHPNSERDLDFYFNKMKCIDKKALQV